MKIIVTQSDRERCQCQLLKDKEYMTINKWKSNKIWKAPHSSQQVYAAILLLAQLAMLIKALMN